MPAATFRSPHLADEERLRCRLELTRDGRFRAVAVGLHISEEADNVWELHERMMASVHRAFGRCVPMVLLLGDAENTPRALARP